MSKAFTRESDDAPEPAIRPLVSVLPPGVKNYITPKGAEQLRRESERLTAEPVSPASQRRLYELQQSLMSAVVVASSPLPWEQVQFGAWVTVCDRQGEQQIYQIVGVDETDIEQNRISWRSPLAKALLKAKVGEEVRFRVPAGEEHLKIIGIRYD
jgi:transcription elongation factor GreB